jgi:hypothetical protein
MKKFGPGQWPNRLLKNAGLGRPHSSPFNVPTGTPHGSEFRGPCIRTFLNSLQKEGAKRDD